MDIIIHKEENQVHSSFFFQLTNTTQAPRTTDEQLHEPILYETSVLIETFTLTEENEHCNTIEPPLHVISVNFNPG